MPSSNFKFFLSSLIAFGTSLAFFNIFTWSQPPSVLAQVNTTFSRSIASTQDQATSNEPRLEKILAYNCEAPEDFKTFHSEVRIALVNCALLNQQSLVRNEQNHFQATLFAEEADWLTDFIPLREKENQIQVYDKGHIIAQIKVHRTSFDAE